MALNTLLCGATLPVFLCAFLPLITASPVAVVTSLPALTSVTIAVDTMTASPTSVSSPAMPDVREAEFSPTTTCTTMQTPTCTPSPTCTSLVSSGLSWISTASQPISIPVIIAFVVVSLIFTACLSKFRALRKASKSKPTKDEIARCWADHGYGKFVHANSKGITNRPYMGDPFELPPGWFVVREPGTKKEMMECWLEHNTY